MDQRDPDHAHVPVVEAEGGPESLDVQGDLPVGEGDAGGADHRARGVLEEGQVVGIRIGEPAAEALRGVEILDQHQALGTPQPAEEGGGGGLGPAGGDEEPGVGVGDHALEAGDVGVHQSQGQGHGAGHGDPAGEPGAEEAEEEGLGGGDQDHHPVTGGEPPGPEGAGVAHRAVADRLPREGMGGVGGVEEVDEEAVGILDRRGVEGPEEARPGRLGQGWTIQAGGPHGGPGIVHGKHGRVVGLPAREVTDLDQCFGT